MVVKQRFPFIKILQTLFENQSNLREREREHLKSIQDICFSFSFLISHITIVKTFVNKHWAPAYVNRILVTRKSPRVYNLVTSTMPCAQAHWHIDKHVGDNHITTWAKNVNSWFWLFFFFFFCLLSKLFSIF